MCASRPAEEATVGILKTDIYGIGGVKIAHKSLCSPVVIVRYRNFDNIFRDGKTYCIIAALFFFQYLMYDFRQVITSFFFIFNYIINSAHNFFLLIFNIIGDFFRF